MGCIVARCCVPDSSQPCLRTPGHLKPAPLHTRFAHFTDDFDTICYANSFVCSSYGRNPLFQA